MNKQETKEVIQTCFTGLCQYAGQVATAGKDTANLRTFAVQMVEFWGLDNAGDGDRYEQEFDQTTAEAIASGTTPDLTEEVKDDIIEGLQVYRIELFCVGGPEDNFYKRCDVFLDSLKVTWGRGDHDMLEHRLDACLMERFKAVGRQPRIETLHELGHFIAMHDYLTGQDALDDKDINRLLRFQDPLEVAVDCAEGYTLQNLELGFLMDRAEPELTHPMIVNEMPLPEIEPPAQATEKKRTPPKNKAR
ncbi:MAG: hypothetical protein IJT94_01405 [Oscillibacter sp.]|nr:hypothetical protein [Oscillibacter sp.]